MARELAIYLRRCCNITGVPTEEQIDELLARFDVEVWPWDMPEGLREVRVGRRVYLDRHLSRRWRRWLKLHGLAHVLVHSGNQIALSVPDTWRVTKQEHRANLIAGWVLMIDLDFHGQALSIPALCEEADIPEESAARFWAGVHNYMGEAETAVDRQWALNAAAEIMVEAIGEENWPLHNQRAAVP